MTIHFLFVESEGFTSILDTFRNVNRVLYFFPPFFLSALQKYTSRILGFVPLSLLPHYMFPFGSSPCCTNKV